MKRVAFVLAGLITLFCLGCTVAGNFPAVLEPIKGNLLYENLFSENTALDDFTAEGPAITEIKNGKLYLASSDSNGNNSPSKGHFVFWNNKVEHPDDFILEWEFAPVKARGLTIMFVNAKGVNGKDALDPSLASRDGSYKQYHSGDINNYGWSYYRYHNDFSGVSNVRRNVGFKLVNTESNIIPYPGAVGKTYHMVLYKKGSLIQGFVNGQEQFSYLDPNPWEGGRFGLRQMSSTKANYDNLKVWALKAGGGVCEENRCPSFEKL